MTQQDRERLDRIEAMLAEVLAELRRRPRKARRRGPLPPDRPVSQQELEAVDAALAAAGILRR